MTRPGTFVGEGLTRDRDEAPRVPRGLERQGEDAVGGGAPHFAVRDRRPEGTERGSARADDELANPVVVVCDPVRRLRRKPLIVMIVSHEDDLGAVLVERPPEDVVERLAAMAS